MSALSVSLDVVSDDPAVLIMASKPKYGSLVALYRSADNTVAAGVLPDEEVVLATFRSDGADTEPGTFSLAPYYLALYKERFPLTSTGRSVLGYRDPTMIHATAVNPFSPEHLGIMASQVYRGSFGRVGTNLIYYDTPTDSVRDVLTSARLRQLGIPKATAVVKEGELLISLAPPELSVLIFQYSTDASNIGVGLIEDSQVITAVPFWTAADDGSSHVSPAGAPVQLADGRLLLFYNRCRGREHGVAYMILDLAADVIPVVTAISDDFVIRADVTQHRRWWELPKAFASSATLMPDGTIEVLYYVNGSTCRRAVLQVSE